MKPKMRNKLKVWRAEHELTQAELADKIKVSKWAISQIELNNFIPSVAVAIKIARALKVPVETLFLLDDPDYVPDEK